MKKKKLQVFISSTFEDLKEERQAAVEAILSSGHIPAGMELFSAGDESQMKVIQRWIEESDVYMLILGGRYGSIESESGKSYTQLEYEYAVSLNKPLFSIVIHESTLEAKLRVVGSSVMEKEYPQELKEFKKIVLAKLVKFYQDIRDIKLAVYETMSEFSNRKELIGWVRADELTDTTSLVNQLGELAQKNKDLKAKIKAIDTNDSDQIGHYKYDELKDLLNNKIIDLPNYMSEILEDAVQVSLLELFIRYQEILSIGLNDKASAGKAEAFLIVNLISKLRIFELAEIVKVPSVAWSKYQTSKLGNKFLAIHALKQNGL